MININHYHRDAELQCKGHKEGHEYALLSESDTGPHPPLTAFDNHDYDEPYFEPALKEEELIMQLKNLSVPVVGTEHLKYVSVHMQRLMAVNTMHACMYAGHS